ncbi:DUF2971 domain-containing protein [Ruminiclostridium herbifermentans]|uniref:DUF2971 domain-containing protein n=1 Tax=Ruminiclostridium herbifermentans TaxID=2488810 RepID=A0A4U7JI60_9FIRM|nr:DUF2971 domain-containing protein [Ruminiclostridium herbifermentans]QNU65454.1 DUF2971 domain-containing protein [Ruminiclostridium herbifermentans]
MTFNEINILAVDNLIKILKEKVILGSTTQTGYVIGDKSAVCFQDVPLYALIQNVEHERKRRERNSREKLRYCGVGLSFIKPYMYATYGARPVIYEQTDIAKALLQKEEWWRIVKLDFKKLENEDFDIVDWSHEREWRVPGDMKFEYDNDYVHIILYNPNCFVYFLEKCHSEIVKRVSGITTLTSILM